MRPLDLRLGVDVGGTNTDAVILDRAGGLLAKAKVATTPDVTSGIAEALAAVLAATSIDRKRVTHVMLGTTHAANAVLERRHLQRVAVVRIGGPATHSVRPLFGWPSDLRQIISGGEIIVNGGIELDGRELSPFDADAMLRFVHSVRDRVAAVAVTSVFAPVSARHEEAARDLLQREFGDLPVSLSHEIGSLGLLERENATVLNAALRQVATDVAEAMRAALAKGQLDPLAYFTQNDGTLMALDYAVRYPVLTIGSGAANSTRGAAFLTGVSDALVMDVGGTSTDVGVLVNGFPRESSYGVEIGGIRTNFRMPDLVTIALGGGTVVEASELGVRVGPHSVGYRLQAEAQTFGGPTLTLTDCGVGLGRTDLGDRGRIKASPATMHAALAWADNAMAEAIDRAKTARGDRPLIAVGGGSVLVPERLPGVSEVIRPRNFDVANAIGAAIASVSGQVDRIFHLGPGGREALLAEASAEAREKAVAAGADPRTVEIVEIEELPLAYLTNPAVRVRVKAAGALAAR